MLTLDEKMMLMRAALDEARIGLESGEAPIGCVLARGAGSTLRIISRGYNMQNRLQRKVAHAEMVAFENAGVRVANSIPALPLDAEDAILVSTLEPCVMCFGAAMEVGIKQIVFGLQAPADNGTHRVRPPESPDSFVPAICGGILAKESRDLFVQWLSAHENTSQSKFVKQLLALTTEFK